MGHRKLLFAVGERGGDGGLEVGRFGCGRFGSFAKPVEEDLHEGRTRFLFFFRRRRRRIEFAEAGEIVGRELESVEDEAAVVLVDRLAHQFADDLHNDDLHGCRVLENRRTIERLARNDSRFVHDLVEATEFFAATSRLRARGSVEFDVFTGRPAEGA